MAMVGDWLLAVDGKEIYSAASQEACDAKAVELGIRAWAVGKRRKAAPIVDETVLIGLGVIAAARSAITTNNKKKNEILIQPLGDDRWGLFRDGVVVFIARTSHECNARANALYGQRGPDRGAQDAALVRLRELR